MSDRQDSGVSPSGQSEAICCCFAPSARVQWRGSHKDTPTGMSESCDVGAPISADECRSSLSQRDPQQVRDCRCFVPAQSPSVPVIRALVVDDDPVNLKMTARLLRQLQVQTVEAADPEEALLIARNESFGIIFLDIHMPKMSGSELARKIRKSAGPNRFTPMVAVTTDTNAQYTEDCQRSPLGPFLHKPLSAADLLPLLTVVDQEVQLVTSQPRVRVH